MLLGVNIDHVATLRQARRGSEPDPCMAVPLAILGGADGVTLHLREDRRHVSDRDLDLLREIVFVELNLEMTATREMVRIALRKRPDLVTLVPEKREELTTEGGLNILSARDKVAEAIKSLQAKGIRVSLFIDPSARDIEIAREIKADMVEIHTGMYANARGEKKERELRKVARAVGKAIEVGLTVNAGHGLNYHNVSPIAALEGLRGLYIGHSIIARAVLAGMERAVRDMKELIWKSKQ